MENTSILSDTMAIHPIDTLTQLIQTLRGDNGCPWDKQQTAETMSIYLVEEMYELLDAIDSGNVEDIREELGDVLFQLLFIACLYEEDGHFNIEDVARENRQKMIDRHPHVFGEKSIDDPEEVRRQWRRIKKNESRNTPQTSVLDSVPRKLPALMRAYRISERAAGKGFDWDDINGVMAKTEEEWAEFKAEMTREQRDGNNKYRLALEFGDILFTLVNVARFARFHPENALSDATRKFETRFRHMEEILSDRGQSLESVPREELECLWEVSKKETG